MWINETITDEYLDNCVAAWKKKLHADSLKNFEKRGSARAKAEVESCKEQISDLKDDVLGVESQLQQSKREALESNRKVNTLQRSLAMKDNEISSLNDGRDKLLKKLSDAKVHEKNEISKVENKLRESEKKEASLEAALQEKESELKSALREIEELKSYHWRPHSNYTHSNRSPSPHSDAQFIEQEHAHHHTERRTPPSEHRNWNERSSLSPSRSRSPSPNYDGRSYHSTNRSPPLQYSYHSGYSHRRSPSPSRLNYRRHSSPPPYPHPLKKPKVQCPRCERIVQNSSFCNECGHRLA